MITQINLRNQHLKIREINAQREINAARAERGTALLELAVFGMVTMAALGLLIRIGMQANFDQEVRMGAFRRALAAASADDLLPNGPRGDKQDALSVSYYYMLDRQMPNPTDGFLSLTRNRSHASAFVERGRWLTFAFEDANDPEIGQRTHPRTLVRLNDQEQSFRDNQFPCDATMGVTCHGAAANFNQANEGIIRESWTTNLQSPGSTTISQTEGGSGVSTTTTTESEVVVNLKDNAADGRPACGAPGVMCSTLSSTASVGWSH